MARKSQPINADVPAAPPKPPGDTTPPKPPVDAAAAKPAAEAPPAKPPADSPPGDPTPPSPASAAPRTKREVPGALKGIGALVLVAVVFIVAAIVGGSDEGDSIPGAAPGGGPEATVAEPTPELPEETVTPEELGYPEFATNNTTRVGGADPASNAAGVALAVFPSAEAGQRPAAVTLVDEADWRGAIAAAVLMAEPVRAPILISSAEDVPDATAAALDALDPAGSPQTRGAQVFQVGHAAAPGGHDTTRVNGIGTTAATKISQLRDQLFRSPPRHIVVAPAARPDLAAPAAGWAARSGDPVLFANPGSLPKATVDELRRHRGVPVYVLGPSSAISSKVVRQISRISDRVRRVSGEDAVTNAIALARYDSGEFGWNVNDPGHGFVVARSGSPLDAAAAAPLSASGTWGPLLLTDSADTLPAALRDYLLDVKPGYTSDPTRAFYNHVWVIGDEDAIAVGQQAQIDGLAELAKIGGAP